MTQDKPLSSFYRSALTSPFWMFFYLFFIVSFVPYFIVQLFEQQWLYSLLYTSHGLIENMTVVLYVACLCCVCVFFVKYRLRDIGMFVAFALALFMLGEETRWGLGFIVDDLHDVYFSGMQDILFYAAKGAPDGFPLALIVMLYVVRLLLFIAVGAFFVGVWYYRHHLPDFKVMVKNYPFSPHIIMYGCLIFGVIVLELFLQPGPKNYSYIEETFELNAALIWLSFCYEVSTLSYSRFLERRTF